MAANPTEPAHRGDDPGRPGEPVGPRAEGPAATSADGPAGERAGPVAIARHVKADGRALILYSREAQPPT